MPGHHTEDEPPTKGRRMPASSEMEKLRERSIAKLDADFGL